MAALDEKNIFVVIAVSLFFFALTLLDKFVKLTVAFTVLFLLVIFLRYGFNPHYTFNPIKGNTIKSLTIAAVAFFVFTLGTNYLQPLFTGSSVPYSLKSSLAPYSGFVLQAASSYYQPGNALSAFLTIWGWGIIITTLETLAIVYAYSIMTKGDGQPIYKSVKKVSAIAALAMGFLFLHIFAKTVDATIATFSLFMVAMFAIVTILMAEFFKEAEAPTYFHIITNVVALAFLLKLFGA